MPGKDGWTAQASGFEDLRGFLTPLRAGELAANTLEDFGTHDLDVLEHTCLHANCFEREACSGAFGGRRGFIRNPFRL